MNKHPGCFLCQHSLPDWLGAIETNSTILHFKKGALLFGEGEPVTGFFFLHAGTVKVHKQWGAEKEIIIKFARQGDVLGHRGFGDHPHYPVSVTALENSNACFISTEFFQTTLLVNHELAYRMTLFYANELQNAELSMRNLAHMDVKSRIAYSLLSIREIFGIGEDGSINSMLTRQDIASYAGTTYETLFKTINELVKDSVIASSGKQITILDEQKLSGMVKHP